MKPIYLDYNATTPVDPAVFRAMLPFLGESENLSLGSFGNPSSTHLYGLEANRAVEKARSRVAALLNASPSEIIFTGGGSEASNQAIKGAVFTTGRSWQDAHLIISAVEHPATYSPCHFLQSLGCTLTTIAVDGQGMVDPDDVRQAITPRTRLVSIMHSNNELGTLMPIAEIAKICRERQVWMHADAAQSLGKVPVDVQDLGVDFLTIAGHKLDAPKGVGALYVRAGVGIPNLIHGAGQERGRRAGTENVPYIVAFGKAAELAEISFPDASEHLQTLRERLYSRLKDRLGDSLVLNGHPTQRLPNTLNVSFLGSIGSELLEDAPAVAASTGAACHEGQFIMSPIFHALGSSEEVGRGAVRLTVGRFTTSDEVDLAAEELVRAYRKRMSF